MITSEGLKAKLSDPILKARAEEAIRSWIDHGYRYAAVSTSNARILLWPYDRGLYADIDTFNSYYPLDDPDLYLFVIEAWIEEEETGSPRILMTNLE